MIKPLRRSQTGMTSIVVTMIIMIVLSIIVIGFAQISRKESQSALDRQLSTQAFYAAQSGVNDAKAALASGLLTTDKNTCGVIVGNQYLGNNQVDSAHNVSYTCLLIYQKPTKLHWDSVDTDQATIADITATAAIKNMTIKWYCPNGTPCTSTAAAPFPSSITAGTVGSLRLALTDLDSGSYSRDNLNNKTYTAYLYPRNNGGGSDGFKETPANINQQGDIVQSNGCAAGICSVTILGIGHTHVFLNLTGIYKSSAVDVTATDFSNNPVGLGGAQAEIDSTGKAQNILRRIQVRVPVRPVPLVPTPVYSVQSVTGICKTLEVSPQTGSEAAYGQEPDCHYP